MECPEGDSGHGSQAEVASIPSFSESLQQRVEQLVHRLQPATHSESRRTSVANYVSDVISICFAPIEVGLNLWGQNLPPMRMTCDLGGDLFAIGQTPHIVYEINPGESDHVWICASAHLLAGWRHRPEHLHY